MTQLAGAPGHYPRTFWQCARTRFEGYCWALPAALPVLTQMRKVLTTVQTMVRSEGWCATGAARLQSIALPPHTTEAEALVPFLLRNHSGLSKGMRESTLTTLKKKGEIQLLQRKHPRRVEKVRSTALPPPRLMSDLWYK